MNHRFTMRMAIPNESGFIVPPAPVVVVTGAVERDSIKYAYGNEGCGQTK